MLTAMPPSITQAEARALTGSDEAPRLLDYLYRRHLFTDRRRGSATDLPLPRAVPRVPARRGAAAAVRPSERATLAAAPATLLERAARPSGARALPRRRRLGGDAPLIAASALDWARQGRAQALSDWIEALPARLREADPWLDYWFGRAWIFVQPARGRPRSSARSRPSAPAGDLRGQALALNTIVTGTTTSGRTSPRSTAGCPSSTPARRGRRHARSRERAAAAGLPDRAAVPQPGRGGARAVRGAWTSSSTASRPQRADDGRLDAVQLPQLDTKGDSAERWSRGSSRCSRAPRSRR